MRTSCLPPLFAAVVVACSGPSATHDAAPGDAPTDATTDTPAADAMDTAMSGALGSPCAHDTDCTSGICLSIGRCSIPCAMRSDCPMGPNWACEGVPGRHGPICACAPSGNTEIPCNSIDDDCDGVVDNGDTTCAGHCTNLMTDSMNCGTCGIPCAAGSVCQNGTCGCPPDRPLLCGVHCVNSIGDVLNCGSCGNTCATGANASAACLGGMCSLNCFAGFGDCDHNPANGCEADTRSSVANCGACGHTCVFSNASATCSTGSCVMGACNAGFSDCDSSSLNGCESTLATDAMHCGACGHSCTVPNALSSCASGACMINSCTSGFANCDGDATNGCEVDLHSDPRNCGVCGGACPGLTAPNTTATCSAGGCGITCASGFADCDGVASNGCETSINTNAHCGSCTTACPTGMVCGGGACSTCPTGTAFCGGACIGITADTNNCGACGHVCPSGGSCVSGTCVCPSGTMVCGAACTNVSTDPSNCGSCGNVCPAGQMCVSGACSPCPAGQALCGGTCIGITMDTNNCGGCGHVCATGAACASGSCLCATGSMVCGSACTNTTSDPFNCGTCGHACPIGGTCSSGSCTCPSGATTCGSVCSNPNTDSNNCGSCGHACQRGAICSGGTCMCPSGYVMCGAICTLTTSDPQNCGSCGTVCPTTAPTCSSGGCTCTGTVCSGACTDTRTDRNNCGSCGNSCPSGTGCAVGSCLGGTITRYTYGPSSQPWIEACGATGATVVLGGIDDGCSSTQTLPFTFHFFDSDYTAFRVSADGYVTFDVSSGCSYGTVPLPAASYTGPALVIYGRDLVARTGICTATVGTAPNRSLVVEANDEYLFSDTTTDTTFEIVLHEGTNTIDYLYNRVSGVGADGSQEVVGMQSGTSSTAFSTTYERTSAGTLYNGLGIHFVPSM